jgi:NADH-quinone oxidoreductase subunit G
MKKVDIHTEKQILQGRDQDRKKISMKDVPYNNQENS